MNKKNKVLLASVGLVLLSGVAATTTTFAWFTTVRTASVSFNDATVYSASGNLAIAYKSSKNTVTNSGSGTTLDPLAIAGSNKITDISGNGLNFYKPVWSAVEDEASSISEVGAVSADNYYIDFTVTISRSNDLAETGMKIYLGAGSNILPKVALDAEDEKAVLASRLAVINYSDSGVPSTSDKDPNVALLWAPAVESTPKYLEATTKVATPGTAVGNNYNVENYNIAAASTLKSAAFATNNTIADADLVNNGAILTLATGVAKTADVTFRVWLEGTDADAINTAVSGVLSINLNLYALEII